MSSNTENKRPSWVIPVIGFLVGLLIGWWLIGWWLWPVNWTNALPVDLKAAERDQYLLMVAESYAVTRNADLARSRLSSWSSDQLAEHLTNLQARAASNAQRAAQVQGLADLVGATRSAAPGAQPPATGPSASQPSAAAGTGALATLRTIATAVLWVILLAVAIAAVYYLWRRWRAAHNIQPQAAIDTTMRAARPRPPLQPTLDEFAQEPASRWVSAEEPVSELPGSDLSGLVEPLGTEITEHEPIPTRVARVTTPPPAAPPRTVASATPTPPRQAVPTAGTPGGFVKVGEYRALYQVGEPDYDEAFDIADVTGGYLGQCGLELNDPVGRGHDQAAALQAWLWDTNDPDTKVKVLMSEGAYRDTATRDELKGEHEAIAIRAGTEFELESYKLLLRGRVEKIDYSDQEPPSTIFAELSVRYVIYRKA